MDMFYVIKRDGSRVPFDLHEISSRIQKFVETPYHLDGVDVEYLTHHAISGLSYEIHTEKIDNYVAGIASSLATKDRSYLVLASRMIIDSHHKMTLNSFSDKMKILNERKFNGKSYPFLCPNFYKFTQTYKKELDEIVNYDRDFLLDYFGFKTLENAYLLKANDKIIERPQDMFMRSAVYMYFSFENPEESLKKIKKVYDDISQLYYTPATPTLFNAGTRNGNLSSCFLLGSEDSLEGILKTQTDCAKISKSAGGIGIHASMWRAEGSLIRSTNGASSGIVPFLRIFNDTARAFNQGGKRNGSFAIYLEPHHPDILKFLELRLPQGDENLRCRDLFLAIWISDLFMKRVEAKEDWSLFCPDAYPRLNEVWGEDYEKLYLQYEAEAERQKKAYEEAKAAGITIEKPKEVKKCSAYEILFAIFKSQKETGMPYVLFKDTINRYSMQSNCGIIQSSNLCSEITLISNSRETAVCNLSSICLSQFVHDSWTKEEEKEPIEKRRVLNHEFPLHPVFNYTKLTKTAGDVTENLNQVIDRNFYPTLEAARSNFLHRPIGIGVQGLADVFLKFGVSFDSIEAAKLNRYIAEAIYYGALVKSTKLAKEHYNKTIASGQSFENVVFPQEIYDRYHPSLDFDRYMMPPDAGKRSGAYPTYTINGGSPLCNGKFHWELYGLTERDLYGKFDWDGLRKHIDIYGVRNSMTTAYMPTASTSQIMGNSSCFEPYMSNMYERKTKAGNFIVINKYLMHDLQKLGVWNDTVREYLMKNNGSVKNVVGIPEHIKEIYKTAWELKQKKIMELAANRQPFIDQSQSMNLFMENFTQNTFSSMILYAWRLKLKTGNYYVRTKEAVMPQKFTLKVEREYEMPSANVNANDEEDECILCSS